MGGHSVTLTAVGILTPKHRLQQSKKQRKAIRVTAGRNKNSKTALRKKQRAKAKLKRLTIRRKQKLRRKLNKQKA
jgi:hypothetical protein